MSFLRVSLRHGAVRLPFVQIVMLMGLCAWPGAGASAQETVNYASVSGRVTDPQGAVVAGAQVTARQIETNIAREAVTDAEGRFRFAYLRLGPYEIAVRHDGFADTTRRLNLTVGSAFDLPIALALASVGCERDGERHRDGARGGPQSDRGNHLAGRSRQPSTQRAQLPRYRAPRAGRLPAKRRRHAALRRDVGRSGRRPVDRQPA